MNPIALAGSDTVPSSMSSPLSSHQSQLLQARGWGLSPSSPGSRPPGAKSRPPGAKTRPPGAKFAGHLTRCSLIPWCLYVWAVSYKCKYCGKVLADSASLSRHINSIHNGVKYPCKYCDYQATISQNLDRHIKAKHTSSVE